MPIGLPKETLQEWHSQGVTYEAYLADANDKAMPWREVGKQVQCNEAQIELLAGFVREMRVLVLTGIWCGDCSAQGPMLAAIAEGASTIDMRWIDRDEAIELSSHVKINAGNRVPTVIFMAEDFEPVSVFGDRTLPRYRAIAKKQLGASCAIPGAPVPQEEVTETMQAWVDEFERVQLLLRLSTRLRKKHGD